MNILNNDFIELLKTYAANVLRLGSDRLAIDFRSIFVGDTSSIGVLGVDSENIIITDSYNSIAVKEIESSDYLYNPINKEYNYFLGYIGDDMELLVDDTYKITLSSKNDNTGFFFETLRIKTNDSPKLIYTLRFRRLS